jgi:hypothetical protein
MNNRYVLRVGCGHGRPVQSHDSKPSREVDNREVDKSHGLRRGQILSVRKACDKFLESRGLKQLPFGTFVLRKKD